MKDETEHIDEIEASEPQESSAKDDEGDLESYHPRPSERLHENEGYPPPRAAVVKTWPDKRDHYPHSGPLSILWPASLFIVVLLLGVILAAVSRSDTVTAEPETEAELEIEEGMVFFQLDDIEDGSFRMTISIYITNYGEEESGEVRVNIYAENKFNDIVYDSANKTVDPIGGRKTIEVTLPIELPDNNSFRIRIFLFEAGLIKILGYGEVSLTNIDQTVVEYTDADGGGRGGQPANDPMSYDDSEDNDGPGFGLVLLIVGMVGATILTQRSRRNPNNHPRRNDHDQ